MKHRTLLIGTSLLIILSLVVVWFRGYVPAAQVTTDSLVVGTSADFPPFSLIDNGVITGFDIDLIYAIAQKLDKKVFIKNMPFDMLLPELQTGGIQLIAAGLTATPERAKQVLFVKPHLDGSPFVALTLAKNAISSLDQLKGKTVAVNTGYTADTYMSKQPDVIISRFGGVPEAVLALESQQVYAFVSARNVLTDFLQKKAAGQFATYVIPGTSENSSFGVSTFYPELRDQVEQALTELQESGAVEELKKKWGLE